MQLHLAAHSPDLDLKASPGLYHVTIRLLLPQGREVDVGRTPSRDERHADPSFAVNDAFKRVSADARSSSPGFTLLNSICTGVSIFEAPIIAPYSDAPTKKNIWPKSFLP
jgi:hypothetical protein